MQEISGGGFYLISDNKYHGYRDEILVPGEADESGARAIINRETGMVVDLRVAGRIIYPRRKTDRLHINQVAELIRGIVGERPTIQSLSQ